MSAHKYKIFAIGLSRTGTTSLGAALEVLGYKTLHFSLPVYAQQEQLFPGRKFNIRAARNWQERFVLRKEIKAAQVRSASEILARHDALCDLPFPLFFRELDIRYPNSKFILTTRPLDTWLQSMRWLMQEGKYVWGHGYLDRELLAESYGTSTFNEDILTMAWFQHHREVRDYFSQRSNDLLVLDIAKGDLTFEKLCPFLAIPTIDSDFPKTNGARQAETQSSSISNSPNSPILQWVLSRILK